MLFRVDIYYLFRFAKQLQRVSQQQGEIIIGYVIRYAPEVAHESATWRNRYHLAGGRSFTVSWRNPYGERGKTFLRRRDCEKKGEGKGRGETSNAPVD